MTATVFECDRCGAPTGFRAPFCAYCHAPLAWNAPPNIERGPRIVSRDYRTHVIDARSLTRTTLETTRDGVMVTTAVPFRVLELEHPARDTVTAVEGVVFDRGGALGVIVRAFSDAPLFTCYVASIVPSFRTFRLSRNVEGADVSTLRAITEWEATSVVRPNGEPNVIEMRTADSVLEVHVNGTRLATVVDASLAFGCSGFRIFSLEKQAHVLVRRLDVFEAITHR